MMLVDFKEPGEKEQFQSRFKSSDNIENALKTIEHSINENLDNDLLDDADKYQEHNQLLRKYLFLKNRDQGEKEESLKRLALLIKATAAAPVSSHEPQIPHRMSRGQMFDNLSIHSPTSTIASSSTRTIRGQMSENSNIQSPNSSNASSRMRRRLFSVSPVGSPINLVENAETDDDNEVESASYDWQGTSTDAAALQAPKKKKTMKDLPNEIVPFRGNADENGRNNRRSRLPIRTVRLQRQSYNEGVLGKNAFHGFGIIKSWSHLS